MIIGVDAGSLSVDDERLQVGVYQFSVNLLATLSKIDKKNIYYLYSFDPIKEDLLNKLSSRFKNKVIRPKKGWFRIRLPLQLRLDKVDLFLGLSQAMPSYHPFRTIGFIHALDMYKSHHLNEGSLRRMKKNTDYLIDNADVLFVASKFLEKSVKNVNPKKDVRVIRLGVAKYFLSEGKKYKKEAKYFIFVGSLKPSKNIKNIILAFSTFCKNNIGFKLIIAGSNFWSSEDIEKLIKKEKMTNKIKFIGFIKNEDLPPYYRGALALVSPSLYEGFGIPIVEAMSCGCPVIAGNRSAEKELIRKGGILVDPLSVIDIVKSMEKISKNNKYYRSKALVDVKGYSWDSYSSEIYKLIQKYEKK